MVHSMGNVISTEARAKYNQAQREGNHRIFYGLTFWSPNINIFRDPRWGRGQETYGEDPFLTGRMGVAFVDGVQGDDLDHLRAVATSKHFAVHSGPEPLRHGFNVDPSPRDLEETYLPAFRATVTEGHVQSVMCAYNSIDELAGLHQQDAAERTSARCMGIQRLRRLRLRRHRRREPGPQEDSRHRRTPPRSRCRPAPISPAASGRPASTPWPTPCARDWSQKTSSPRPPSASTPRASSSACSIRKAPIRSTASPSPPIASDAQSPDVAQGRRRKHRSAQEQRRAAAQSAPGHIAVIGPTADSAALNPRQLRRHAAPSRHAARRHAEPVPSTPILYAQGSTLAEGVGVPVPRTAFGMDKGLKTEFFATPDWTGRPVATETEPAVQADWENAKPAPEIDTHQLLRPLDRHNRRARSRPLRLHHRAGRQLPLLARRDLSLHARWQGDSAKAACAPGHDLSAMGNFNARPALRPPLRR